MDETALVLDPLLRRCWMKRGQQRRVPLPASRPRAQQLFAGLNWRDGTLTAQFSQRRNSEAFVTWLEKLMVETYPDRPVLLVLDNVSFHHSLAAQAACALFESRLQLLFLPVYAPHLNPIERYWAHLKQRVCANRLFANMEALQQAIVNELTIQNDTSNVCRFQMSN